MSKARPPAPQSPRSATTLVAEPSSSAETKGSINLRIEANTRQIIEDAAAVLLDQRLFVLESDRYDAFVEALDNPPAPGPKLRALMRRVPAWRK